jgi:acetyl esterase/lipase
MKDDPELFAQASIDSRVTSLSPPTYLYHARADMLVEPAQALLLEAALRRAGVQVELDLVPWSSHVTLFLMRPAAVERAADFLERRLRPG